MMCRSSICVLGAWPLFAAALGAAELPLEWGPRWSADVPYEVNVNTARLARAGYRPERLTVAADGRELPTTVLPGDHAAEARFRFDVPAGTRALKLVEGRGAAKEGVPNFFVDALKTPKAWSGTGAAVASGTDTGFLCSYPSKGREILTRRVPVPAGCAGQPVRIEVDAVNRADECFQLRLWFSQYDAAGEELPENVNFGASTSGALPPGRPVSFRVPGRFHPRAAFVQVNVQATGGTQKFDRYGRRRPDTAVAPRLELGRLALRPAADLPFPAGRAGVFAPGVSGEKGDEALVLNDGQAFWFNTRSSASWQKSVSLRDEKQIFYPMRDGTLEAWFKPSAKQAGDRVRLFDAASQSTKMNWLPPEAREVCSLLSLDWLPEKGMFELAVRSRVWVPKHASSVEENPAAKGSAAASLKPDEWNHVAVTFAVKGKAVLYVNGHTALELPIPDYVGYDLTGKSPNTEGPWELFVGSSLLSARFETDDERRLYRRVFFTGLLDDVRVSTGVRYTGPFTPEKNAAMDDATRASFRFDHTFDGESASDFRFIPGSFRAVADVRSHVIPSAAGGDFDYYPAELPAANNPLQAIDRENFADLPTADDFAAARRAEVKRISVVPGDRVRVKAPKGLVMDWVEIANTGSKPLARPIILNQGEVDLRSWGDFADTFGVGSDSPLDDRTNVDRIFAWLCKKNDYFIDHVAHFVMDADIPYNPEFQTIRQLISYGRFECGPLNGLMLNGFLLGAGLPIASVFGYGHGYGQVYYDGEFHIYDLSARLYFPTMDNESTSSLESLNDVPMPAFRAGGAAAYYQRLAGRTFGSFNLPYQPPRLGYILVPGERLRLWRANAALSDDLMTVGAVYDPPLWANADREEYNRPCGSSDKKPVWRIDRFVPDYANGVLALDWKTGDGAAAFERVGTNSFVYRVQGPHPVAAADYGAWRANGRPVPLSISSNGGKTFEPLTLDGNGHARLTYRVRGREAYHIRVEAPLADVDRFRARTVLQLNPRVLTGELHAGANELTFRADGGEAAEVSFGYRAPAGRLETPDAVSFGGIPGFETHLTVRDGLPAGFVRETRRNAEGGEKPVTVFTAPGARLLRAPQKLSTVGDEARFACDLPAGRYAVLALERFASHEPLPYTMRLALATAKGDTPCCSPINDAVMLHKQEYGRDGGRGLWKWDFPIEGGYPFQRMAVVELGETKEIRYRLTEPLRKGPLEIEAVLVVPWPDRELRCEMMMRLCGLRTLLMPDELL